MHQGLPLCQALSEAPYQHGWFNLTVLMAEESLLSHFQRTLRRGGAKPPAQVLIVSENRAQKTTSISIGLTPQPGTRRPMSTHLITLTQGKNWTKHTGGTGVAGHTKMGKRPLFLRGTSP